jgi:hypothetical protein
VPDTLPEWPKKANYCAPIVKPVPMPVIFAALTGDRRL